MKLLKIILSLFVVVSIFSGCSSKRRVVSVQKELPAWYIHPSTSNTNTLYSVAEGENKSDAIANALNDMVSTLSISISSEFSTKSVVKEGSVESVQITSINDIKTRVEKIRINNYELINSNNFSFERFLVQVKTDKKSLFQSLHQDLDKKFQLIENKNKEAQNYYALKKLNIYSLSLDSLYDVDSTLAVMHSLDADFDESTYIQKIQDIENKYARLLSKISFTVNSNNDARKLRSSLSKGLSEKQYKINNLKNKNHFTIYISSKTSKAKSYGFDLARSAISITVKDYKGNIVGSNKLNITGQSTQGYKIAGENVAIKLNTLIVKEGIANIIGLEI